MKKHILYSGSIVVASLVIAAALILPRHTVQRQSDNSGQLKELLTRVGQLESKAAALEKELEQVRRQAPNLIYTPANELFPAPATVPAPEQIPPGWKPYPFNGTTYYITPLGTGMEISMVPAR